jgi:hypothetical protein
MFIGIGLIGVPMAAFTYVYINGKRDALIQQALEKGEMRKYTEQDLRAMGDRAPDFRYII